MLIISYTNQEGSMKHIDNRRTEKMLSKLPIEVHAVLEAEGFSSRIESKELLYLGIVFDRKPYAWFVLPATILLVGFIDVILSYTASAILGPILIFLVYSVINELFKSKFYLFITSRDLFFINTDGSTLLQIDGHQIKSMHTSFVNGKTSISFMDENNDEQTIKFQVHGTSSGSWRSIENALVMTDFSNALVNEERLKQKYMR